MTGMIEDASHQLCAALHMDGIDPAAIEISLPFDAWWRMYCRIEQLHRGLQPYDGRSYPPTQFQYMGINYKAKK